MAPSFPELHADESSGYPRRMPDTTVLERWNAMTPAEAMAAIRPCCGSSAWAAAMAARRPIASADELERGSAEVWRSLDRVAWAEAFGSHPRIGERKPEAETTSKAVQTWSGDEQRRAMQADTSVREQLVDANARYEERFGRIFLICASGRSAEEILAALQARLANDEDTEWTVAAEQQPAAADEPNMCTCSDGWKNDRWDYRLTCWIRGSASLRPVSW